jgi:hypothetical protein
MCEDIDECNSTRSSYLYVTSNETFIYEWQKCDSFGAICTNTIGGYVCECKKGFSGDGYKCFDIDECNSLNDTLKCSINSECVNKAGTYECKCKDGFKKDSHGACVDIDECAETNHECQKFSDCINTIGSYRCSCSKGFYGNGLTCEGIRLKNYL